MKQNLSKAGAYLLQIILTALASAAIALLQNWLATHGAHPDTLLNPTNTAVIGGTLSSAHMTLKTFKSSAII